MKTYTNRFAEIEENPDGSWNVFNRVTGLCVKESVGYQEARGYMVQFYQHYSGVEHGQAQPQ